VSCIKGHTSDTNPFDVFNYGANLWKTEQFQEDFIDRIRLYVEECGNMQVNDYCDAHYD
jgi:hypothetical protein